MVGNGEVNFWFARENRVLVLGGTNNVGQRVLPLSARKWRLPQLGAIADRLHYLTYRSL